MRKLEPSRNIRQVLWAEILDCTEARLETCSECWCLPVIHVEIESAIYHAPIAAIAACRGCGKKVIKILERLDDKQRFIGGDELARIQAELLFAVRDNWNELNKRKIRQKETTKRL